MIGFANAEGGLIVVGIHEGRVEGVGGNPGGENGWRQAPREFSIPPVPARFEVLECTNTRGQPDHLLIIEVEVSEHVHENQSHETYLRVGDENRRLGPVEAQELRYDKGTTFFDGTPARAASRDDLDDESVADYLRRIGGTARPENALASRGLLTRVQGRLVPTVAGLLVLGRDPQVEFPEARIRLLRYQGTARESGERSNVLSDVQIGGPLRNQIQGARNYLRRWLGTAIRLRPGGRFRPQGLIPQGAWLEAVVNAVVHRSYSMGGDHIRVAVFGDRVEVESPGRLPGLVRIETMRSIRYARNPRIARAVLELGFGRELGEGVVRMFEDMQRAGLPDPIFRQGPASVSVALLMDPLGARMLRELPAGSERLVEYLLTNGTATTSEARDLLGVSVNTARRYLNALLEAGYLEHDRQSVRDPHGRWRIAAMDATAGR